jgi:quercetin dioxygenase-like cupin family protein
MNLRRLLAVAAILTPFAMISSAAAESASVPPLPKQGSAVFKWENLAVKSSGVGERRDVTDLPTATLDRLECHISTLNPGLPSHAPHQHPQEEMIILKEGRLQVHINGTEQEIGPGSVFFFASYDWHAVRNIGDKPATYFVFNFATDATHHLAKVPAAQSAAPEKLRSAVYEWAKLPMKPTAKGERREVFDSPTVTLTKLETHVTTLNPGETPHAPHHHPDEEIILVKEGQIEAAINGASSRVGPGSILFFSSNDEHGLRNVGDSAATYYVIRLATAATPAPTKS